MSQRFDEMTLLQWAVPLIIALWGGIAGYLNHMLSHRRKFSWLEFASRATISGFAGINTFLLTDGIVSELYRAGMVGMAGWLGMESLAILRNLYRVKIIVDPNLDKKT
jgi:hypothetical protein